MPSRRVLFTSLCTAIVGIGFALPAFSGPLQGGGAVNAGSHPSIYNLSARGGAGQFPNSDNLSASARGGQHFSGYPCTWSGSRDLARGETAYQSGRYGDAIAQWKTAASKDCAVAAYKLGMLYYGGKSQVAADRSLGAAWLQVAAVSKTASNPHYRQMSQLAVGTLTKPQRTAYAADFARLRTSLGLPTAQ
jgi:hypothetical protein